MKIRKNTWLIIIIGVFALAILPMWAINTGIWASYQNKPENKGEQTAIPNGFPHITNFSSNGVGNMAIEAVTRDEDQLMLFLNQRGLVVFNGAESHFNDLNDRLYTLKKDSETQQIYAAGENTFGYFEKTDYFKYTYHELKPANSINDDFTSIIFSDEKIWFQGRHSVYSLDKDSIDSPTRFYYNNMADIAGAFFLENQFYVQILGKGLFNMKQHGSGTFVVAADSLKDRRLLFSVPHDDGIIIGTDESKLYFFNGSSLSNFETDVDKYLRESTIADAVNLSFMRFALITVNGGAVIINKATGREETIVNFRTGLPDDEIYAGYFDEENGLWLSHQFGISRIMPDLPVSYYDNFPGREGKVYDLSVKDSTLYLATGQGVYYLTEIKDYKEIEKLVTERVRREPEEKTSGSSFQESTERTGRDKKKEQNGDENQSDEVDEEEPGKLKKFWRRLTGKEKEGENSGEAGDESGESDGESDTEENAQADKKSPNSDTKTGKKTQRGSSTYRTVKRSKKVYELQSVKHQFKKAENINGKCKQFEFFDKGLAVASNNGLFFIRGTETHTVIKDEYIHRIMYSPYYDVLTVLSTNGLYFVSSRKSAIDVRKIKTKFDDFKPNIVTVDDSGRVFLGGLNRLLVLIPEGNDFAEDYYELQTRYPENIRPQKIDNQIFVFTSEDVFEYERGELRPSDEAGFFAKTGCQTFVTGGSAIKVCSNGAIQEFGTEKQFKASQLQMLCTQENISFVTSDIDGNLWAVADFTRIMKIKRKHLFDSLPPLQLHIVDLNAPILRSEKDNKLYIREGFDSIKISLSAPSYFNEADVEYVYELDNIKRQLKSGKSDNSFILNSLPAGQHSLSISASDRLNRRSNTINYTIVVRPHFVNTVWFYLLIIITLSVVTWYVTNKLSERKRRLVERHNRELEEEVRRRTEKIRQQNEKILADNKKIEQQNHEISRQSQELFEQNREITDSIRYAQRIQTAVLPDKQALSQVFAEHFILFRPRDIVSGDFYWSRQIGTKIFIAAADCTGHGIPGGFVSMLGVSFLNEIIDNPNISTGEILDNLRDKVIDSLHQTKDNKSRDGMDIALIGIDTESMVLEYSGAHNPLVMIRNDEVFRIKGDRMPVGYSRKMNSNFSTHEVAVQKGDVFYMFSDGFSDQFGGDNQRKFTSGRFRNLLYEIHSLSMENQKDVLDQLFDKWSGNTIQMDDLLVVGIKI